MTVPEPRLTSLSHGGGCGCKIAPGVLSEILKGTAAMPIPPETPLPSVPPSAPSSLPEQPPESEKPVLHPMLPPEVP